ncbi:hypothetical protein [Malikia spinosa]|uniref:hypothetical protein n=1 Tax=Malikia spinosa TaxID=86180 RepID=UPI00136F3C33
MWPGCSKHARRWGGSRKWGIIWHPQGAGKSIAMLGAASVLLVDPDARMPVTL